MSKKKLLIFIKHCMLTLDFRKLGEMKCKALWVVDSVNFNHLQKDKREKTQSLLYY